MPFFQIVVTMSFILIILAHRIQKREDEAWLSCAYVTSFSLSRFKALFLKSAHMCLYYARMSL